MRTSNHPSSLRGAGDLGSRGPADGRCGSLRQLLAVLALPGLVTAVGLITLACASLVSEAAHGARGLAGSAGVPGCSKPYSGASPWNAPIGAAPNYEPDSAARVAHIGGNLSSDPTQYTYPVYEVVPGSALATVTISGWFSNVIDEGTTLLNQRAGSVQVPAPASAAAAAGSESQVVIVDPATGDEWGFFQFSGSGVSFGATNGYHYNTGWSGVPPRTAGGSPFVSRGAGVTYLAGLVRPCEIARGRIDHALAFAYSYPTGEFVYPATKSDGASSDPLDVPEGARLQLDPTLSEASIRALGCDGACLTIARALQEYGMYVIDNSGSSKVMMEFEGTAGWNGAITRKTVSPLPLSAFKVLKFGEVPVPPLVPPATPPPEPPPAQPGEARKNRKKGKKQKPAANRGHPKGRSGKRRRVTRRHGERLLVSGFRVKHANLQAGTRFSARLLTRERRRGSAPANVQVRCPASVGRRPLIVLRTQLRRDARSEVVAVCEWYVPRWAEGRRLTGSVTVAHPGGKAEIEFTGRVKPRR